MQTNMQTIGLRKTRPSSLVNQTSKIVVGKRPTMQSSRQLQSGNINLKRIWTNDKFKTLNWKETVKYCKKIAKSKTYKKLCENTVGSSVGKLNVSIEKKFRGATAGQATWYGAIRLKENNCPYTIVHEFAHLCGNMHHDIGFRRDVIKLASVFLGKEFGNILKRISKMQNSRLLLDKHIMSPEQWIASVMRMEKIRESKS